MFLLKHSKKKTKSFVKGNSAVTALKHNKIKIQYLLCYYTMRSVQHYTLKYLETCL